MKPLLILSLLLVLSISMSAQSVSSSVASEVKGLIQGVFDDVWSSFDSTAIKKYHTEDFVILENGEPWDNHRIKTWIDDKLESPSTIKRSNSMHYINMEQYGDAVWVAYHNYATWSQDGQIIRNGKWLESAVAVKTNTGWKLKMMHSTWVDSRGDH